MVCEKGAGNTSECEEIICATGAVHVYPPGAETFVGSPQY